MEWLKVKNWEKYQHYKNRNPPWIKLHANTLNDRAFTRLSCASRGLLMQLWILASENDGKIQYDIEEMIFRLRDESIKTEDVKALVEKGFLRICKHPLADESKCLSETEAETEAETDNTMLKHSCPQSPADEEKPAKKESPKIPPCPHQKIRELYHEMLPELMPMKIWTSTRQQHLQARWRQSPDFQSLDFWKRLFAYIKKSDFLMGRKQRPDPDKPAFKADLDWVIRPQNFAKIIEGKYENKKQ